MAGRILLAVVLFSSCRSPLEFSFPRLSEARDGWTYAWEGASGARSQFHAMDPRTFPARTGSARDLLILHYVVPNSRIDDPALYLAGVLEVFEVWFEGRRIYTFGAIDGSSREYLGTPWHVVPIPEAARGKVIEFRIHSDRKDAGITGVALFGSRADLYHYIVRSSAGRGVLGTFFLLLGVFVVVVFLPSLMRRDSLAFAAFLFLMGLHVLSQTPIRLFFIEDTRFWLWIRLVTIYLLPPSYGAFVDTSFSKKGDWIGRIWMVALAWGLISMILTPTHLFHWHDLVLAYYPVVALTGLVAVWLPTRRSFEKDHEAQIFLAGFAGFLVLVLPDLLGGLRWSSISTAHAGMFLLVCSIAFILMRRHSRVLRDMAHISGELRSFQREVEITYSVHMALLPAHPPLVAGLTWSIDYLPSARVGGDFYDFAETDDGISILLADVTGHGVPAAVFASSVKMAFGLQRDQIRDPATLLQNMSLALYGRTGDQLLTACSTFIDLRARRLVHGSAGHMPLLLWKAKTRELKGIKPRGRLMGFSPELGCRNVIEEIDVGDRIILYTDGLVEASNNHHEAFGEERLMDLVRETADVSIEEFRHRVRSLLQKWNGGGLPLEDDLTLLVVQITACR